MKRTREDFVRMAIENIPRLAAIGVWPPRFDRKKSLLVPIPEENGFADGINPGLACALNVIPEPMQLLSAMLHGGFTPDAVHHFRQEQAWLTYVNGATWYLAVRGIPKQTPKVSFSEFKIQLEALKALGSDKRGLVKLAQEELERMRKSFLVMADGIPFATSKTSLQNAYLLGYDWGVWSNPEAPLYFLETFQPSLGLDDFPPSKPGTQRRAKSGLVGTSKQLAKMLTFEDLGRAIAGVRQHLGLPQKRR